MAKNRQKTKAKKISFRLNAIIICIPLLTIAILAITNYFGIFTYEELMSVLVLAME